MNRKFLTISFCLLFFCDFVSAQRSKTEKYPSLLWEITGNGLTKPSYLFGTMHVSNKLAFHLSDSFYNAIKSTDAVALELNPDLWQDQMVKMDKLRENYQAFVKIAGNDYVTQHSFRIKDYTDELKLALQSEPPIVNNLLYRSYKLKEDFEEDTFLDLYIFQTGRKLGKRAAGVEDYYESQKLVLEAYADMAKEKKKKNVDYDYELMNNIGEKLQNAYRRGDLDLMDSLDLMMERSDAFREKFLYKRNEIQANSIDSIIKNSSLFVGVGAAHLPGNRGVIELLRKKGYNLRPVKMIDKDGLQRDLVDSLKVSVVFQRKYADDHLYSVEVPGDLYKVSQDYFNLDRRQYADMSNGSYYIVTRVRTYGAFFNQPEDVVLKKVDSLLYENIPGKILVKKAITKNNYQGFDISSKTRIGDLQRYQIFVTPFEIIVFKMSGKENYVQGNEAMHFFSSIALKENSNIPLEFQPAQGGFSIKLPQQPLAYMNEDRGAENRWEYEAVDTATGNAYLILKKSVYNYHFIDEDSFDLGLIETSFRNPDFFDKQLDRRQITVDGLQALEVKEKLKDSSLIKARYFINGPHQYVVAVRYGSKGRYDDDYLNTFSFKSFRYSSPQLYVDTFLRSSVMSPVVPEMDAEMRKLTEQMLDDASNGNNASGYISYWPKEKRGVFRSDSTGEMISVSVQEYPGYYYIRDSAKFWKTEINDLLVKKEMFVAGKPQPVTGKDFTGFRVSLRDTGSARAINNLLILKGNCLYTITSVVDTVSINGTFLNSFFDSFSPEQKEPARNLYESRLQLFFSDLFSKDSAVQNKAQQSVGNVFYGVPGIHMIMDALNRLNVSNKKYFDTKAKLITELGYIKDSSSDILVTNLKKIYDQTADTALFQNEVVKALAKLKTKASYKLLKDIILENPPIFQNKYEYNSLFDDLEDSLALTAGLFPEMLSLSSLEDYKEKIIDIFSNIVDSGYAKPKTYKSYLPGIYIDAKVFLKKQQSKDEHKMSLANKTSDDDEPAKLYNYNNDDGSLDQYSILLVPFYEKNKNVRSFFSHLLNSGDEEVRLNAAVRMIRNNIPVDDSILVTLAANDKYRASLLNELVKAKHPEKFPLQFKTQLLITRSLLVTEANYNKLDSIVFLSKQTCSVKGKTGLVYFYKYRIKKEGQWKIGITGLQPLNENEVDADDAFTEITDARLKDSEPVPDQLNTELKKILFTFHKSAKNFYRNSNSNRGGRF